MGLLNDLFPKTVELVPRAIDKEFEPKVLLSAVPLVKVTPCADTVPTVSSTHHYAVQTAAWPTFHIQVVPAWFASYPLTLYRLAALPTDVSCCYDTADQGSSS